MNITILLIKYKYWVFLPLSLAEGPIVAIAAGFFIHLGYLAVLPSYLLLLLGDFVPDSICYFTGKYSHKSKLLGRFISKSTFLSKNLDRIETMWHTHTFKTMLFTKLAYGLSLPLLIISGKAKLPYKKFVTEAMTVSILQYALFLTIGYYFGKSYVLIAKYVKYTGIAIGLIGVLVAIIYIFIKKYAEKEITSIGNDK